MSLNSTTLKTESCNNTSTRRIWNLIGNWEVNSEYVMNAKNNTGKLGVCDVHYNIDKRTDFHSAGQKQNIELNFTIISHKRCLFCNNYFHIYTRGKNCQTHAWRLIGKDILLPCLALYTCKILDTHESIICEKLKVEESKYYRARYICQVCINNNGGHIYIPPGKGKKKPNCDSSHDNEYSLALQKIGNWILNTANSTDENLKYNLLSKLSYSLSTYWQKDHPITSDLSSSTLINPPSIFIINTCLKLGKAEQSVKQNLSIEDFLQFGQHLGKLILKENKRINENKEVLESPTSLEEYYDKLPKVIIYFFRGLVSTLLDYRHKLAQKMRKWRMMKKNESANYIYQEQNPKVLIRIVSFLTSIILTIAYSKKNFWITYLMSSICQRPKLLTSLMAVLRSVYIVAHTQKYECYLEKKRMKESRPQNKLLFGPNIWNLAVIDNIDFIQHSFHYRNIYDVPRKTIHTTLHMVFQYTMPIPLYGIVEACAVILHDSPSLFSISPYILENLDIFSYVFKLFLNCSTSSNNKLSFNKDFDNTNIHETILTYVTKGCFIGSPNIVILEAGGLPNDDEGIVESCEMYSDEIEFTKSRCYGKKDQIHVAKFLDIASDEAIFRRILEYKEHINNYTRVLLGPWHTSKDMISVIINIFSGYGIFNCAAALGVKYLNNFQKVVEYRAASLTLDLIWTSVGIALHLFAFKKQVSINFLLDEFSNNYCSTWALFWKWTSFWKAHKIGIRTGNFDLQINALKAFAPLFTVAGKLNYATSVCHYLAEIDKDPQLETLLKYAASVNLAHKNHYYAYDEALETFGVKYIKKSLTKNPLNEENLKLFIKSAQSENARIQLLFEEFLNLDQNKQSSEHIIISRKEKIWVLALELLSLFENPNQLTCKLLQFSPELTQDGYNLLFTAYHKGQLRMESLLKQEVYSTEIRNTTGRRCREVNIYTYTQIQELFTKKSTKFNNKPSKLNPTQIPESIININLTPISESMQNNDNEEDNSIQLSTKKRRIINDYEKGILDPLAEKFITTTPSESAISEVLSQLNTTWERKDVLQYVRNRRRVLKGKGTKK